MGSRFSGRSHCDNILGNIVAGGYRVRDWMQDAVAAQMATAVFVKWSLKREKELWGNEMQSGSSSAMGTYVRLP